MRCRDCCKKGSKRNRLSTTFLALADLANMSLSALDLIDHVLEMLFDERGGFGFEEVSIQARLGAGFSLLVGETREVEVLSLFNFPVSDVAP